MPMPHEYVSNKRITQGGVEVSLVNTGPGAYALRLQDHFSGGVRQFSVSLSKDDVKAIYLALDDVVATF